MSETEVIVEPNESNTEGLQDGDNAHPMSSAGPDFPLISAEETARIERVISAHKLRETQPKVAFCSK